VEYSVNSLKSAKSVNSFKHKSKELFFDNLRAREEDPYIYYWLSASVLSLGK